MAKLPPLAPGWANKLLESRTTPMSRAYQEASKCAQEPGKADPTPFVGAVVTRGREVLGVAYRGEINPGDHAEFTLLEGKLADVDLAGATLYTTLEPCTNRTPPKVACANRIIERGISTVYIGTLDPNPIVRGLGELMLEDAGIKVSKFVPRIVQEIRQLNRQFFDLHPRHVPVARTDSEKLDPVPEGIVGPNGNPIGYDIDGNKVEWIKEEDGEIWPMILRRSDDSILKEYKELWDKVWWNRHMVYQHDFGREDCPGTGGIGCAGAARVEKKYGIENLGWDDVDWGLLQGKMSALSWVMGSEWEESLDT